MSVTNMNILHPFAFLCSVSLVLVFLSASLATEQLQNTDNSDLLSRQRREVEPGSGNSPTEGSGIDCSATDTQVCEVSTYGNCTCSCKPGFFEVSQGGLSACTKVKAFGGKAVFTEQYDATNHDGIVLNVEKALVAMFDDNKYYVNAKVTDVRSGSTVATYTLYYQNVEDVNITLVEGIFAFKYDCTTGGNDMADSLTLNLTESCSSIVDQTVLCQTDGTFANYCNLSSTTCSADDFGYVSCPCLPDYYSDPQNSLVCIQQVCKFDADCNGPFGWCKDGPNGVKYCQCMWGFFGNKCYLPWMFTLTVVAAGCGVIIIILIISTIYCSKKAKKKDAISSRNLYESPDTDLKHPFSDFNPGAMRARVPGSNHYDHVTTPYVQEMSSSRGAANGNGHTNRAYETSPQAGSSTFSSPKKSSSEHDPTDYF